VFLRYRLDVAVVELTLRVDVQPTGGLAFMAFPPWPWPLFFMPCVACTYMPLAKTLQLEESFSLFPQKSS